MRQGTSGYLSVVGQNLVQPILHLIEALESTECVQPNEVQAGHIENGYSASIIALSVFLMESAIRRSGYLKARYLGEETAFDVSALRYFETLLPGAPIVAEVEELFALRDVIVHSHLWEANVEWDDQNRLKFASEPKLVEGFGDQKFHRILDSATRKSKRLSLNLFPPRIWRQDAFVVFSKVLEALLAIEALDRNYFYISDTTFKFKGGFRTLSEIRDFIELDQMP